MAAIEELQQQVPDLRLERSGQVQITLDAKGSYSNYCGIPVLFAEDCVRQMNDESWSGGHGRGYGINGPPKFPSQQTGMRTQQQRQPLPQWQNQRQWPTEQQQKIARNSVGPTYTLPDQAGSQLYSLTSQ